jgi:glycosyltransferase involved in cell wall biosynthesis
VICPSEAVREAALTRWGLARENVRVVRSGAGKGRAADGAGAGGAGAGGSGAPGGRAPAAPAPAALSGELARPFVLAVGALEPRKLPGVLVEAHAVACARGLRAPLVFAGDGPLRGELERSRAILLGHVTDDMLEGLYAGALALACVSRDEGFGFTPVEALARGVPAVVADLPVFEETLGEGALRVPPGDVEALAEALLRLEREQDLRRQLVAAGREAVKELSWERAARETRAALAEAAA